MSTNRYFLFLYITFTFLVSIIIHFCSCFNKIYRCFYRNTGEGGARPPVNKLFYTLIIPPPTKTQMALFTNLFRMSFNIKQNIAVIFNQKIKSKLIVYPRLPDS